MKKYTRISAILILIIVLFTMVPTFTSPIAYAKDNKDKPEIGDKKPLSTGDEATLVDILPNGDTTWSVKIGDPVYIPGTNIKYDTKWKSQNGVWVSGDNDFVATVIGRTVTVVYQDKTSTWTPTVNIGKTKKDTSLTPELLAVDPINPNYINNTLKWDYGNGVTRYLRIIEGMLLEYYKVDKPQNGDIVITNNMTTDTGFTWHRAPNAYDSKYQPLSISVANDTITLSDSDTKKVHGNNKDTTYPLIIDPDTSFTASSSDAQLWQRDAAWATLRAYTYADYIYPSQTTNLVETAYDGSYYYAVRSPIYFNTASIPDDVTITDAKLYVNVNLIFDNDNAGIYLVNGMPTNPADPPTVFDFAYTKYGSFAAEVGYNNALSQGSYQLVNSSNGAALKSIISKTGTTKLMMVERRDFANEAPIAIGEDNYIYWYSYEAGTGLRPYLDVTYTASAPTVVVNAASNVAKTTARLNATVTYDGGEACQIRWGYGTTSKAAGDFATYDTVTDWTDANYNTSDHPYDDIASLSSGTTYYFRVQIKNTNSTVTSTDEQNFETDTSIDYPSILRAIPGQTTIRLSWVPGNGSSQVRVVYKTDTYPTTTSDGALAYEGTATVYTLSNLSPGRTYYFSAWGESGGVYSDSYKTGVTTTEAFGIAGTGDDMPSPSIFTSWFATPDYTNLANIEPLYSAINGVADSLGMPRNNLWMGIVILLICVIGAIIMGTSGFHAGVIVTIILLVFASTIKLMPSYITFLVIIISAGLWLINAKGAQAQ